MPTGMDAGGPMVAGSAMDDEAMDASGAADVAPALGSSDPTVGSLDRLPKDAADPQPVIKTVKRTTSMRRVGDRFRIT